MEITLTTVVKIYDRYKTVIEKPACITFGLVELDKICWTDFDKRL